jgi:hypothetical protein
MRFGRMCTNMHACEYRARDLPFCSFAIGAIWIRTLALTTCPLQIQCIYISFHLNNRTIIYLTDNAAFYEAVSLYRETSYRIDANAILTINQFL